MKSLLKLLINIPKNTQELCVGDKYRYKNETNEFYIVIEISDKIHLIDNDNRYRYEYIDHPRSITILDRYVNISDGKKVLHNYREYNRTNL